MNKMKTLSFLLIALLVLQFFLPNVSTYVQAKNDVYEDTTKLNVNLQNKSKTKLQWQVTINEGGEENNGTETKILLSDGLTYSVEKTPKGMNVKETKNGLFVETEASDETYHIIVNTNVTDEKIKQSSLEATTVVNGKTYYAKKTIAMELDEDSSQESEHDEEEKNNSNNDEREKEEQQESDVKGDTEEQYIPLEMKKGEVNNDVVPFAVKRAETSTDKAKVSHTVQEVSSENICRRNVEGEITFTLPTPKEKKPVDIVVAQDASGSYAGNARQAKQSLKDIVDLLDLNQDRMMVTSFQGYDGWYSYRSINDYYNGNHYANRDRPRGEQALRLTDHTGLSNNSASLKRGIDQIMFDGATPSAKGLQFAKERYDAATRGENLDGRKTIFIFITDGVANAQLDGRIHIEHNGSGWTGHTWAEQYQFYVPTFQQVVDVANDIKSSGYDIVSAYWENRSILIDGYGRDYYDNTIGPAARNMVKNVASDPNYYSSNEDLAKTISELLASLQEAINKYDGFQAEFAVAPGFELVKDSVYVNGTKVEYTENGNNVTVTLDEIKSGESTLTYELRETSLHPDATKPITNGTISYDKDRHSYKETVQIPITKLKGNKNSHNCQEVVNKFIAPVRSNDFADYLQIDDMNEVFTYKLQYQFDGNVGKYETVKLRDDLESVLQVVGTVDDVEVNSDNIPQLTVERTLLTNGEGVEITVAKKNGSYDYLAGKTITVMFQAKVRDDVTNDDLAKYEDGNVPNVAKLVKDERTKHSNNVYVGLPQYGSITLYKVDEAKNALQDAEFTLTGPNGYKETGVSDANGMIRFGDLPLGTYTLKETRAPDGYRLLTEEMTIEIRANQLHVEKEIENTLASWEIPKTGGIGTFGFYSIGLLLMFISALYYKRKKLYLN